MSQKTDFITFVTNNIVLNTNGEITDAIMRQALIDYLADFLTFNDELGVPTANFKYERLSNNNTSPSSAQFSFKSDYTEIYIHKENASGTNMNLLYNIMTKGNINIVEDATKLPLVFNVSSYTLAGDVYTFKGTSLIRDLGNDLGDHTMSFDISVDTDTNTVPAVRFDMTRQADNATPTGSSAFALNSGRTTIKITEFLGSDDLTKIGNLMTNGIITLTPKQASDQILFFKVSKVTLTTGIFTFTATPLFDSMGATLGDYTVMFYPYHDATGLSFKFNRQPNGSAITEDPDDNQFSIDPDIPSGTAQLNLPTDWINIDMDSLWNDLGANGGTIEFRLINSLEVIGLFRVTSKPDTPDPGYINQLGLRTILDEMPYSATKIEYMVTFIPAPNRLTDIPLTGTQVRVEMESSITITPAASAVSFSNSNVDSAISTYINVGSQIYKDLWAGLTTSSILILKKFSTRDGFAQKYARIEGAGGVLSWAGFVLTLDINDGDGLTNITNFTTEEGYFIIEIVKF